MTPAGQLPDLTRKHPDQVERMVTGPTNRAGIASVYRYGSDALVIDAPDWDEIRLQRWLTLWLHRHLHTDG